MHNKILIFISLFFLFTIGMNTVQAQSRVGCGDGLGPFAGFFCKQTGSKEQNIVAVGDKLNNAISAILGFLTVIAALWFLIQFIMAGFSWINAGGDKNNAQAAWQKITNAVIGLVIVVTAWVFAAVIGTVLGIEILNPGKMLNSLQIGGN